MKIIYLIGFFAFLTQFFSLAFAQGSNGTGTEDQWKALEFWYMIIIAVIAVLIVIVYKKRKQ